MELLTALRLPHWLMIAGVLLVVVGFVGFAFRKNREAAKGKEQQAAHLNEREQAREGNNGNGQVGGDQLESKDDESASELRSYLATMEDRVLESGNPAAENIVHATRRARERKVSEREVPFRKLLDEEMDRVKAK
jgi:uncharacterized low-complexity protein